MNRLGLDPLKSGKKKSSAKFLWLAAFLVLSYIVPLVRTGILTNSDSLDQPVAKNHLGEHKNKTNKTLSSWEAAIVEAEVLLKDFNISSSSSSSSNDNEATQTLPSCLLPNKEKTSALVRKVLAANPNSNSENRPLLPLPVMNVGMPKCGSTTIFSFFQCAGLRATHWSKRTTDFEGICMRDAASVGLPPIATCASNTEAFMQFDVQLPMGFAGGYFDSKKSRDECFFPQLSLLKELYAENPNLTFVINFRPIHDWVKSVRGWQDMMERFQACHLPNLPRGYPKDLDNTEDVVDTMTQFFCSHVQHIRNFAEAHPSIALIELDLYDNDHSRETLSALFPSDQLLQHTSKCWSHENRSSGNRKKKSQ